METAAGLERHAGGGLVLRADSADAVLADEVAVCYDGRGDHGDLDEHDHLTGREGSDRDEDGQC